MKKLRLYVILSLFLSGAIYVFAQQTASEKIKPQWLHKLPIPSNTSFIYETVTASAPTLDQAREKCISELITMAGLQNGAVVISDNKSKESLSQVWENGKLTEKINYSSETENTIKGQEVKLYVQNIAEYWERDQFGNYYLTRLFAKSELDQPPLFDEVELTTKYGGHGLWRSAIVPGWGQFYKGSTLKGSLILGGTVALAGGIIYTQTQYSDYTRKIGRTHSEEAKRSYSNKRDNFASCRNICIGAISALYVYNIIDAIVAPGARRVVTTSSGQSYAIAPTLMENGAPGIAAAITF